MNTIENIRTSILRECGDFGYIAKVQTGFEIRVNGNTHAVAAGVQPTLEKAIKTLTRLSLHPTQAKTFLGL